MASPTIDLGTLYVKLYGPDLDEDRLDDLADAIREMVANDSRFDGYTLEIT